MSGADPHLHTLVFHDQTTDSIDHEHDGSAIKGEFERSEGAYEPFRKTVDTQGRDTAVAEVVMRAVGDTHIAAGCWDAGKFGGVAANEVEFGSGPLAIGSDDQRFELRPAVERLLVREADKALDVCSAPSRHARRSSCCSFWASRSSR